MNYKRHTFDTPQQMSPLFRRLFSPRTFKGIVYGLLGFFLFCVFITNGNAGHKKTSDQQTVDKAIKQSAMNINVKSINSTSKNKISPKTTG